MSFGLLLGSCTPGVYVGASAGYPYGYGGYGYGYGPRYYAPPVRVVPAPYGPRFHGGGGFRGDGGFHGGGRGGFRGGPGGFRGGRR
ncbi:MAG: hypothetical protein EOO36_10960 [Cytophagaceae bacterium]|nr:MAG: hypothetical protein EOO36_10960 [Cytophagaceae bacterium]